MLINGQWLEASETFEVKTPADGSFIAKVQKANKDNAEQAVQP
jgi:acyl-CoA reductase-like NAD-dependent aldehyde dehydrogenase